MKTCQDVMTSNPTTCLPTDSVKSVADLMRRESFGSLPVVENQDTQKLIGIITDRDMAMKVVAKGLDANATNVEAVMTRKVISFRPDDNLQLAMDAMSEHQLRRIVIVDKNHKVLGIIAQADVATRGGQPDKTAEVVKDISQSK